MSDELSEAQVIKHAKKRARELGLRPLRISMRPGVEAGWPDFFVFGPNRHLLGMETKRPGREATPLQMERGREMTSYGFAWCKPDTREQVDFALVNFARRCIGDPPVSWDEAMEIMNRA